MLDGLDHFWRMRSLVDMKALRPEQRARVLPYIRQWADSAAEFSGEHVFRAFSQFHATRVAAVAACARFDYVISPTAPNLPAAAELPSPTNDPLRPLEHIGFTVPFNMSEQPAASINCGYSGEGLPIGLQITGRASTTWACCAWRAPSSRFAGRSGPGRSRRRKPSTMSTDSLGNPLTLDDGASLRAVNDFVQGFIASEARAVNVLQAADDDSPIVQAYCAACTCSPSRATRPECPALPATRTSRRRPATPREQRFIAAVAAWAEGDIRAPSRCTRSRRASSRATWSR